MKERIKFELNIDPIKKIPLEKYSKDFTFIVNGKKYQTNRFIADILSPKIRQYHSIDELINTFYINISNPKIQIDFSQFLSLISFDTKYLNDEEVEYFIEIFSILGNYDEIQKLIPKYQEEITLNNYSFDQINEK